MIILFLMNIIINIEPIYENARFPYNLANLLHFKTKENKIKKLIFFNEDKKDPFLIKESERRLRSLGIFKYAEIKSSRDSDTIYINLKDLFTLSLFTSFEGGGGKTKMTFGIEEHNLFGNVIDAGIFYVKGYERDYLSFLYIEPSFLNSIFDLYFSSNFTKNYKFIDFYLKRPYYTFLKNFPYLNYQKIDKIKYIYENGEKKDSTKFLYEKIETGFLKNFKEKEWNSLGIEFEGIRDNYKKFFSFNAVYLFGKENYLKEKYLRKFGDIEDIFTGWRVRFDIKTDFKKKGFETNFNTGIKIFKIIISFSGSYESYYYKNFNLSFITFYPLIERITIANYILYSKPFENIYIGGTNGLRGYKANFFETREYILNQFEIRIFGPEILKIFAPGIVIFYDFSKFKERKKIFYDFGIGFRGEFTRNYNLPILRFDIAFKDSRARAVYSFGEGQSF
ncbi:MAG: hypothetical protein ABIM29_00525 [candidate division WOR-3 bacterium]